MDNQLQSTSSNILQNTSTNIWFGLSDGGIDEIIFKYAARRYYFTLTGDANSTDDIQIPISSMQCRRRNGASTYLSVVVKDLAYTDAIITRQDGDIVIEMSYWFDNQDNYRKEIARATLTPADIKRDIGGKSQSITLTGYKTETWITTTKTVSPSPVYKSYSNGRILYRFAEPDVYLVPADTVTVNDDTFQIATISYSISSQSFNQMEISS
jgi:hypothetical protein